ncbi:ferric reductase like transmembrane component [Anopheles sinensis]|uniref:Ferric reductase like transmembrane component n=1 Tax=Anopheles sinensis TaxID=74873 RepID=A0A084VVQ6_ANOSI|nr:ferric reductase like transmembrane component [Anopheles sinensis]
MKSSGTRDAQAYLRLFFTKGKVLESVVTLRVLECTSNTVPRRDPPHPKPEPGLCHATKNHARSVCDGISMAEEGAVRVGFCFLNNAGTVERRNCDECLTYGFGTEEVLINGTSGAYFVTRAVFRWAC